MSFYNLLKPMMGYMKWPSSQDFGGTGFQPVQAQAETCS
jgi:hypothetical protein